MTQITTIHGKAGSGKSTEIRNRMEAGEHIILTATSGVSAMNLGLTGRTIHSLLHVKDKGVLRQRLEDRNERYRLMHGMKKEIENADAVLIDEFSFIDSEFLDLIVETFDAFNEYGLGYRRNKPVSLILAGDFLQLPPVDVTLPKGTQPRYAFWSKYWNERLAPNAIIKTKSFRHESDPEYGYFCDLIRAGQSMQAARWACVNLPFAPHAKPDADGIVLFSTRKESDAYSDSIHETLTTETNVWPSMRWGDQLAEWADIPAQRVIKTGARVLVRINDTERTGVSGSMAFVNGTLGTLIEPVYVPLPHNRSMLIGARIEPDYAKEWSEEHEYKTTIVPYAIRRHLKDGERDPEAPRKPSSSSSAVMWDQCDQWIAEHTMTGVEWWHPLDEKWVIGEVRYMPLELGYSMTFHKSQGLTLSGGQVSIAHAFSGSPQMLYVALSRFRSRQGVTIIGNPQDFMSRVKIDPILMKFV